MPKIPKHPRRSNFTSSLNTALDMSSKALRVASGVAKLVNVEKKFNNVAASAQPMSTTSTFVALSGIPQGDKQTERQGNSIKAYNNHLRANITMNPSATASTVRVILFSDRNSNGTVPSISDLLQTAGGASAMVAQLNPDYAGIRFQVYMDRNINFSINGDRVKTIEKFMKYSKHIKYIGTTAADADQNGNSLWLCYLSTESTNVPSITYSNTLRYLDN